jgi:hypothetical protein
VQEDQYDVQCEAAGALLEPPEVRGWIAASFPIVLVDEAQDLRPQPATDDPRTGEIVAHIDRRR